MDNAVRSYRPDGGLGALIVSQLMTERVDKLAAFIYIPVEHIDDIQKAQYYILDRMDASKTDLTPVDPENLHLTLLYIERAKDEKLEEFFSELNLIMPVAFSVNVTSTGTFQEADDKPVVLHVNPSPALVRLQSELYNTAFSLGLPLSVFSKPENFKPHISLAYGLDPPDTLIPDLDAQIVIPVANFRVTRPDYEIIRTIHLPTFRKADILVTQSDETEESVASAAMSGPSIAPSDEGQDPRIAEMEKGIKPVEYAISIRVLYDPDLEKEAQSVDTTDSLDITVGPRYYEAQTTEHRAGILLRMVGMDLGRRMLLGPGGPHEWTRADAMMQAPAEEMKRGFKYVFGNVSLLESIADTYASLSLTPEEVEARGYLDAARWIGYAITEHKDYEPAQLPDFHEMVEAIGELPVTAGVTILVERGGEGSGHHGHKGRPGEVGGSLPSGAVKADSDFDPETIERADTMPGQCFQASADWLIMDQGTSIPNAKLVHGTVGGQGFLEGKRFTHAWVEIDDAWVYDRAQDLIIPKDQYYELGKVDDTVSYEPDEVRVKLLQTKHWGPWEDFLIDYQEPEMERSER